MVAYLPFQLALNLSPDVDLMSGRVLILGLFGVWAVKELYQKKIGRHPGLDQSCPVLDTGGSRPRNKSGATKFWISAFARMTEGWALALFFILSAISILGAENQIWGLRKLLVFASIFPLFLLTGALIKNRKEAQMLIYVIIGGAAVSGVIALAQFLAQFIFGLDAVMGFWSARIIPVFSGASFGSLVASNPSWLVNINGQTVLRAIGLFPDSHMLSFYLGLTLSFLPVAFIFNKRYRLPLFIVYCLLFIVLLLTFSRGGYLGLLFSLAIFILFAWRKFSQEDKKFFSVTLLLAAVILLLIGWPVARRLISSFDVQEGSNIGRFAIWRDSWEVIKKTPVIGVGLGNYSLAVNFSQDYRNAVTSHNLYLDIWAETGVFALLAWLFMFGAAARGAYGKIKKLPVIALGCLAALAYFGAHSFFETAIFNPTVLAFLMIVLGLSLRTTKTYESTKEFPPLS